MILVGVGQHEWVQSDFSNFPGSGPAENVGVGIADGGFFEDVVKTFPFDASLGERSRAIKFVAGEGQRGVVCGACLSKCLVYDRQ